MNAISLGTSRAARSARRRVTAAVMLLHTAIVLLGLPLFHASLDGATAVVHVERQGGEEPCRPIHNEANCTSCSLLRLIGPAPTRAALPPLAAVVVAPAQGEVPDAPGGAARTALGARAPPLT